MRETGWKFGIIGGEEIEKNGDIYRRMGFLEESVGVTGAGKRIGNTRIWE